ncbi:MAG: phosphoserine phosphatase SerB [Alphaproteobacteria bacterium]|nr:phosphoserine phosphatase SerB [Alphaproteobacteria bacterium]
MTMDYIATLFTHNPQDIEVFKQGLSIIREGRKEEGVYEIIFSATSHDPRATSHDLVIEPYPPAPKKLLISDMDSTMIHQECIDELADFVGKKAHVAAITERAMNGEMVFEEALRERVALLKGLPVEKLQQCFDERITAMDGAKELVSAFKASGGKAVLVSGGFTFFTERVARMLGFDEHYANILEVENGRLTGTVREPILGKEAKLAELHRQCKLLGCQPENVIAIGDGANDLPMLKEAGLGIATHAKPVVAAQVKSRINHGDLSSILYVL